MTVRFGYAAHRIAEEGAMREGVPLAQYVREATLMRVTWEQALMAGSGEFEMRPERWLAVVREIRETMGVEHPDTREG